MTRRLLATLTLAACVTGGVGALATPASAYEDEPILCIGGDNQRQPGRNHGICITRLTGTVLG